MRLLRLAALLTVLTALGCPGAGTTATIATRDLPPVQAAPTPKPAVSSQAATAASQAAAMEALGAKRPMPENQFVPADKASDCPVVHVTDLQNKKGELQLGRAGYVTVVVFWTTGNFGGPAAFRFVSDLTRKKASVMVRAVGIIEMEKTPQDAVQFADQQGINMPLYYDDDKQSALRELTGEVGAKKAWVIPSIFIVDRHLKLRFCRPGFSFAKQTKVMPNGQLEFGIVEDATADQSIEHYLDEVLKENW